MSELFKILQVFVIYDEKFALEVAPVILTAFKEIEIFYNQRLRCIPRVFAPGFNNPVLKELPTERRIMEAKDQAMVFWHAVKGKYSQTVDHEKLAELIKSKMSAKLSKLPMILVTNQEITPPSGWRYIIWDWDDKKVNHVISAAPLDPSYWGDQTSQRVSAIKHRVRVAGLNITGSLLGLKDCENAHCFLNRNVESTDVLDGMLFLGPEHGWQDLTGHGYSPRPAYPEKIQSIAKVEIIDKLVVPPITANIPEKAEWNTFI
jgi:predicted Zn-dependent protease